MPSSWLQRFGNVWSEKRKVSSVKGAREGLRKRETSTSKPGSFIHRDRPRNIERISEPGFQIGDYGTIRDSNDHSRQCSELRRCNDGEIRFSAVAARQVQKVEAVATWGLMPSKTPGPTRQWLAFASVSRSRLGISLLSTIGG